MILSVGVRLEKVPRMKIVRELNTRTKEARKQLDLDNRGLGTMFLADINYSVLENGVVYGGAATSNKTANWIVNRGNASAHDVMNLIGIFQDRHKNKGVPKPELDIVIC